MEKSEDAKLQRCEVAKMQSYDAALFELRIVTSHRNYAS